MNDNTGAFAGTKRFDARYSVVEELTKLGLFVKKEDNPMKVRQVQATDFKSETFTNCTATLGPAL